LRLDHAASNNFNASLDSIGFSMARFRQPPYPMRLGGSPGRRPALLLALSLAFLGGFYALSRHHPARPSPAPSHAPITGHARIVDGDSIRIGGIRIRLDGIDAPEWDQTCSDAGGRTWACGRAATRALRERTRGQNLRCLPRATDRYGRTLAVCSLADGTDVNAWLVRQGWAVAYGYGGTYASEEAAARAEKRGIWAGSFISPSAWRRQKAHGS
jgi:endonuclease YncB( thermonuclease family)